MKIIKQNKLALKEAIKILNNGGIVVCPTDTVYGFLADATNKKAVEKIFKIKRRPRSKPLAVFVKDIKMAKELAEIDKPASVKGFGEARQEKILKKYWPGAYTFVLKKKNSCDIGCRTKLYGVKGDTIALRIPKYKFLNALLKKINRPLAQTSVNISGEPALLKINEIIEKFDKQKMKPDLIIDAGDLSKSKPSKIIDLIQNHRKVIRY